MKEEALELADEFKDRQGWTHVDAVEWCVKSSAMIRRLVEELDKASEQSWYRFNKDGYAKPLSDEEIMDIYKTVPTNFINFPKETIDFARAIEERHGIK